MNQIPFEELMEQAKKAADSDFFCVAPDWAKRHINEFLANDCVIDRADKSGRYNLVRAIREVKKTNIKLERTAHIKTATQPAPVTGKTARNRQRSGYNCPCVTKYGETTGHASRRDHDVAIRTKMRSSKGGK